jgi:hypothetical protein
MVSSAEIGDAFGESQSVKATSKRNAHDSTELLNAMTPHFHSYQELAFSVKFICQCSPSFSTATSNHVFQACLDHAL